ncbi:hypothetical protein M9Y10_041696 [Tritrichomonas musculus]|uniref:Uncharacterized protein n=1 Tax=Tritrichomonas musculus TaxID=1915356 RepID=A0ABR2K544_9EUKA
MYKTSELQFKAKLYDGINDDIIEKYVSKLSQKLKQNSIKVEPQYFYEIHWYSKCCFYEDYRNNTLEPLVYTCLSPEEQEEEDRRKEQERIEKEEQERLIREEQEKQDKKRRIREERERKKQEEINKIEAEKERKRKLQRLHDIENAPRMNKLTGKMYYPNNEFEEVDVDNGRSVPDNENNNHEIQIQTNNQNKTYGGRYIPAPPTMKILSEEEIRRRNIAQQTKLTTKAKQIQNKQITTNSREAQKAQHQHTPTKQTDISNEIPQAPKAIKQQNKNKKVYSPTSLNDSILNI